MAELGQRATCRSCGEPIEYIGPYWRHVGSRPRHVAEPADAEAAPQSLPRVACLCPTYRRPARLLAKRGIRFAQVISWPLPAALVHQPLHPSGSR